jgi:ketosteroid isomerase-like protein
MGSSVSQERAGRAFRLRPEILFHAAALAAATSIVAMGSRPQSAQGRILMQEQEGTTATAVVSFQSSAARAAAEKQIATAEKTWVEAHRRGDAALLNRLLASEFTFTDPNGRVSDTKGYLASVTASSAAALGPGDIENRNMKTHIYGGTAVVSGETVARGYHDRSGKAFQAGTRFLRVYVNRDGRWQMVAGQDTHLPMSGNG